MPKSSSRRIQLHAPSAKPAQRQFAVGGTSVEHVEIGQAAEASGSEILQNIAAESSQPQLKKKEKQQLKRELLLQKIGASSTPYSKSHERRAKRKAKEQIGNGVGDMQTALAALDDVPEAVQLAEVLDDLVDHSKMDDTTPILSKRQDRQGLIGQGRNAPLSQAQRKRALKTEQLRLPIIRKDPNFAVNPFQAIRAHAANTLIKHQVPGST